MAIPESTTIIRGKQAPYIKMTPTLDPYQWTGRCSRVTGISAPLGDVEWTECRSETEVGMYIPDVELAESPGPVESSLVMKKSIRNRIADDFIRCRWNVDVRYQNEGLPGDPLNWAAIDRICAAKFTAYETDDETSYTSDDEGEVLITSPFKGPPDLYHLWRLSTALVDTNQAGSILTVANIEGPSCPTPEAGPGTDCVFVAGTEAIAGNPNFGISVDNGSTWTWQAFDGTNNTPTWTGDIVDIDGLGDLIIAVGTGDTAHAVSLDQGATWTEVILADYAAHAPTCVTVYSPFAIWIGGADGFIWFSRDSGMNATTAAVGTQGGGDAGVVIGQDLVEIDALTDRFVAAVGASNSGGYTTDGGLTWTAWVMNAAKVGVTINTIEMYNTYIMVIGYTDGDVYWTDDRGTLWALDDQIDDLSLADVGAIALCPCERYMLVGEDTDGDAVIYENVHGAPGHWEQITAPGDVQGLLDVTCCHANLYVAVGEVTYVGAEGAIVRIA